jgi:hypothetical protein
MRGLEKLHDASPRSLLMVAVKIKKESDKYIGKDKEPYGQVRIEYADERRLTAGTRAEICYQGIIRPGAARIPVIEHSRPKLQEYGQRPENNEGCI